MERGGCLRLIFSGMSAVEQESTWLVKMNKVTVPAPPDPTELIESLLNQLRPGQMQVANMEILHDGSRLVIMFGYAPWNANNYWCIAYIDIDDGMYPLFGQSTMQEKFNQVEHRDFDAFVALARTLLHRIWEYYVRAGRALAPDGYDSETD